MNQTMLLKALVVGLLTIVYLAFVSYYYPHLSQSLALQQFDADVTWKLDVLRWVYNWGWLAPLGAGLALLLPGTRRQSTN